MTTHVNRITEDIIAAAIKVHRILGPGLYESAYEHCLAHELRRRGHRVDRQVPVPLRYDGVTLRTGYRVDLVVDHLVVVEIKAVDRKHPAHRAQILTYTRLLQRPVGLMLNFNERVLTQGIIRVAWGPIEPPAEGNTEPAEDQRADDRQG